MVVFPIHSSERGGSMYMFMYMKVIDDRGDKTSNRQNHKHSLRFSVSFFNLVSNVVTPHS